MIALHARDVSKASTWMHSRTTILRVTRRSDLLGALRSKSALVLDDDSEEVPIGFAAVLLMSPRDCKLPDNCLLLPKSLDYLSDGDVIRISTNAEIGVMFRMGANANSFLMTERCNHFCVMCSQPPREIDDGYLVDEILEAIHLVPIDAREIGITGGEPTLLGDRFLDVIRAFRVHLPRTALHVLSNGRAFQDMAFADATASIGHRDLMLGIPVYSDVPSIHNFVVQAHGAFDETIRGILNLKRHGVRVEVRMVLHRHTIPTLVSWARFVARNLQFVDHVALMGLELMGFGKSNLKDLWIEPLDYQDQLRDAAEMLEWAGIRTSIYNLPLCLLDRRVWRIAVQSISDWKNTYIQECEGCTLRGRCAGFFSSAGHRLPQGIAAVRSEGVSTRYGDR